MLLLVAALSALLASPAAANHGGPAPAGPAPAGCALIVSGPPRSSSFDHANNVFGGPPPPPAQNGQTCITYDAVNAAFEAAKQAGQLQPVRGAFAAHDIGALGVVIEETSRTLAKQYGLSKDAVANGLPLIDTSKTNVEAFCPPFLMTPKCKVERYRPLTGLCNNLENPHWGASLHGHGRFLPPDYADGINAPRVSVTGAPLPSPRTVSLNLHAGEEAHDHAVTLMLVAWGQYVDHDVTLSAEVKELDTKKTPKCCDGSRNPYCWPIEIPQGDSFYGQYSRKCMNFVRSYAGLRFNCRLGPRDSFNRITAFLDSGTTYGNTEERVNILREFRGGRLKMLPLFDKFQMKNLLPLNLENPDEGCIRPSDDVFCFLAGDPRVNEQTILAMIHTLNAREHNRIAGELALVNPHWSDETLFQETKHVITALQQQITYNEFLPMVLGREVMEKHDLMLLKDGYLNGYDNTVNPAVATSFTAAAFRFGHTLLPSEIERWSKSHRYVGSQSISGMLLQPYDLYKEGWADAYLHGMTNQVAQAMDSAVSHEVQNHLFQEPGAKFGLDLPALNIQRARELGVPSYTKFREWCGLPAARSWDDLRGSFPNRTIAAYIGTYASHEDIDLWSGGIAENPLPGAMVGPTLACIIGKQFHNFRFGDRFWYENGGWPSSFTVEQLNEIRKVKLSRIICDNGDDMDTMQVYAMVLPDHDINPRVPCKSGVLRGIDFSKWRDASFHSAPAAQAGPVGPPVGPPGPFAQAAPLPPAAPFGGVFNSRPHF